MDGDAQLEIFLEILFQLVGGISFFLLGVQMLGDTIKTFGGKTLKNVVNKVTKYRFSSLILGFVIASLSQSVSVTSVLLIGLVDGNLMTFQTALDLILGSGIGATVLRHLFAYQMASYGLQIFGIGYLGSLFFPSNSSIIPIGKSIAAIGLVLYGQNMIAESVSYFGELFGFFLYLLKFEFAPVGALFGAIITLFVQSSGSAMVIFIALLEKKEIDFRSAICLMIGAYVGTSVTSLPAAINARKCALRFAVGFFLIRLSFSFILLFFVDRLVLLAFFLDDENEGESLNVAFALLNIFVAICFFPFMGFVSDFLIFLLPDSSITTTTTPLSIRNENLFGFHR